MHELASLLLTCCEKVSEARKMAKERHASDRIQGAVIHAHTRLLDAVAAAEHQNRRDLTKWVDREKQAEGKTLEDELLAACMAALEPAGDTPEEVQAQLLAAVRRAQGR